MGYLLLLEEGELLLEEGVLALEVLDGGVMVGDGYGLPVDLDLGLLFLFWNIVH